MRYDSNAHDAAFSTEAEKDLAFLDSFFSVQYVRPTCRSAQTCLKCQIYKPEDGWCKNVWLSFSYAFHV